MIRMEHGSDWCIVALLTLMGILSCSSNTAGPNRKPVAVVQDKWVIQQGMTLFLDGGESYDPDGDPLTYEWSLVNRPSGSAEGLRDEESNAPSFLGDVVGTWIVQLIVSDGHDPSLPVLVLIQVQPGASDSAPSGEAPPDQPTDQPPDQPPLTSWVYWTTSEGHLIERVTAQGGSDAQKILTLNGPVSFGISADPAEQKVYFGVTRRKTYVFYRANLDGSGQQEILRYQPSFDPETHPIQDLVLDTANKRILWTLRDVSSIFAWSASTFGITLIPVDSNAKPRGLAVDLRSQRIYWSDSTNGSIYWMQMDGKDQTPLLQNLPGPLDVDFDPARNQLFWTSADAHKIQAVDVADPAHPVDVVTDSAVLNQPYGLALDAEGKKLFWCDFTQGKIYSANRDGSQVQEIGATQGPTGIAFVETR